MSISILYSLIQVRATIHLNLKDAEKMAVSHSLISKLANIEKLKAQHTLDMATAALMPKLFLGLNYDYYHSNPFDENSKINLPLHLLGGSAEMTQEQAPNNSMPKSLKSVSLSGAKLGFNFPIDFFGTSYAGMKGAEQKLEVSQEQEELKKKEALFISRKAYLGTLLLKGGVKVQKHVFKSITKRLDKMQKMYELGVVAKVDVIRMEYEFLKARANVMDAKHNYLEALDNLKLLLNIPLNTKVKLSDVTVDEKLYKVTESEESLVKKALDNRNDYKAMMHAVKGMEFKKWNDYATRLPSLSVYTALNGSSNSINSDSSSLMLAAGIALNIPIYDGGFSDAKYSIASREQEALELQKNHLAESIKKEVSSAYNSYQLAVKNLESSKKSADLAEENFKITNLKNDDDSINALEYLDAQAAYIAATTGYNNAKYQLLISYAELKNSIASEDL